MPWVVQKQLRSTVAKFDFVSSDKLIFYDEFLQRSSWRLVPFKWNTMVVEEVGIREGSDLKNGWN